MSATKTGINDDVFTITYGDSVSPLTRAVQEGDLKKIKQLILAGSLPQTPDNRGWTAIHCCAATNQVNALKLILKLKPNNKSYLVNLTTWDSITPLHLALKSNPPSLDMVKLLLKAGASPKIYTHTNLSPLHLACAKKGNLEFVKLLIEYKADPNVQEDQNMFTPLHFAVCQAEDINIVEYLVPICDLKLVDIFYKTAFLEACNSGFVDAVKVFLNQDKNLLNQNFGICPLVFGCSSGDYDTVKYLLDAGANVNQTCRALIPCDGNKEHKILLDTENFLPIHSALTNVDTFKLLLDLTDSRKLDTHDLNYYFDTFPVHILAYAESPAFYEILLQSKLSNELKKITYEALMKYMTSSCIIQESFFKKLPLFFKYNFHLEPEVVFRNCITQMSETKLTETCEFMYLLARMGISSCGEFSNKNTLIQVYKSAINDKSPINDILKQTCVLLEQTVLPLKNLCRIILRRNICNLVDDNWAAIKMVENNNFLPDSLKKFLLFDIL